MKKAILLIVFLSIHQVNAQSLSAEWAVGLNSTFNASCTAIDSDDQGNIYATGNFTQSVDFDPSPDEFILESNEGQRIFVAKYTSSGSLVWAKAFCESGTNSANDIAVDNLGRIHITGSYQPPYDFNSGAGTAIPIARGGLDAFILHLDNDGNYLRVIGGGGDEDDKGVALVTDEENNVYVTGTYQGGIPIVMNGPGQSSAAAFFKYGLKDVFLVKIDSDLTVEWDEDFGGINSNDNVTCIALDQQNNIVLGGDFDATCNFNPGSGNSNNTYQSVGFTDCFLTKRSNAGNFIMAKIIGGSNRDGVRSIKVDNSGNIYSTGFFEVNVDFNPDSDEEFIMQTGSFSAGQRTFIQKLDADGEFLWAKQIQSETRNEGNSIDISDSQDIFLTGFFFETADFDPGEEEFSLSSTAMTADIYILSLNQNGDFRQVKSYGGELTDRGFYIHSPTNDNVYVGGIYESTFSLGNNITLSGNENENGFLIKIGPCEASEATDIITSCGPFTWIDGNIYSSDNTSAIFTIEGANVDGCDSIVNLNLTINQDNPFDLTVITLPNQQLEAQAQGVSYQWLDCNNNFSIIPGETNQLFTPSVLGFYAIELTDGICTDTSECIEGVILDIYDSYSDNYLKLFPNPGNGNIYFPEGLKFDRISIYNAVGAVVFESSVTLNDSSILRINEPSGLYFVTILSNGKQYNFKYIKK